MVDLDSERSRERERETKRDRDRDTEPDTEESDELELPVEEWRARASTLRSCRHTGRSVTHGRRWRHAHWTRITGHRTTEPCCTCSTTVHCNVISRVISEASLLLRNM